MLSLNTGDNEGFASPHGGAHWHRQQYGGGDNDCSFADARSHSMLIFTPRWTSTAATSAAKQGNTLALYENSPGSLPDVGAESGMRHMVPGPPLHPGSVLWNASSGFGLRGFRPIVQNLPSDDPTEPGDYVFIRFFGNLATDTAQYPNNLAILLRTRHVRDIAKRTDWNTPGGWRVDKHPRLLADITGDGKADIVGFGDAGVWTALANGDGTFQTPQFVLADLGYEAGSWRVDKHPRLLARLTDSGFADIVGFGDAGVYVAFSNGDGTFQTPQLAVTDFGYDAGGWRVDKHPRYVVDITGDGKADLVGFGDAGVYVALNNGDGTFQPPHLAIGNFGYDQHWRTNQHPRFLAHLTNSGYADIVGFGTDGVWTALGNGTGAFSEPNANPVLANFGTHQNWQVDKHPRLMAPLTNSGFDDIVGFGTDGVFVALSNGDGTFNEPHANPVLANFGTHQNWQVDKHPRLMAPLTNSGFDDIVGFGTDGVFVALSNGDGTFNEPHPNPVLPAFGYHQGWRVQNHLRFLADITGDDKADIVGFGNDGVWAAPSSGDGAFTQPQTATQSPLFVIPNFGYDASGPVELPGHFLPAVDAGVVQAAGGHERTVFYLGGDKHNRLWKWSAGITNWQQLIPTGRSAKTQVTSARRFFANPYRSNNIYVLDAHHVFRVRRQRPDLDGRREPRTATHLRSRDYRRARRRLREPDPHRHAIRSPEPATPLRRRTRRRLHHQRRCQLGTPTRHRSTPPAFRQLLLRQRLRPQGTRPLCLLRRTKHRQDQRLLNSCSSWPARACICPSLSARDAQRRRHRNGHPRVSPAPGRPASPVTRQTRRQPFRGSKHARPSPGTRRRRTKQLGAASTPRRPAAEAPRRPPLRSAAARSGEPRQRLDPVAPDNRQTGKTAR